MANPPDGAAPKNEGEGADTAAKAPQFRLVPEKEIIGPDTSLSLLVGGKPTASMNPAAHGWSRRPLSDTRLHSGLGTWGRNKRWEYWGIMTPRHIIGITLSSLDYAGVNQLYVVDRENLKKPWCQEEVDPLARRVRLPDTYAQSDAGFTCFDLSITIKESRTATDRITHITASGKQTGIAVDVELKRGVDADALHVVVPWNEKQFQYTIKEPAIPAKGTIKIKGETHVFGGDADSASFGVLDHGRGRWPYSMVWNWAAGSGYVDGKRVGLQLGAKWTDGTGSTENAVIVNGHLTKISEELAWEYDRSNWLKPWRVTGQNLDATFTPFYERVARTSYIVLAGETHQCFGTWSGTFKLPDGTILSLDGLEGWAEEARNRW